MDFEAEFSDRLLAIGPVPLSLSSPSHGTAAVGFCQTSLFQQGVVGAFAQGFGFLTPDFGVGKSQDLGC